MQEKIELTKSNGEVINVDLISEFDCDVDGSPKRFVLLTANEIDQNGLIKILASSIVDGKLARIESEDEWTLVKNVMRSIISSSKGDFTYVSPSETKSYEVDDNYARVIAVQDSAKQALVNDYNEKKPTEEVEAPAEEVNEDPNAGIYPTENESTPLSAEVVPGIAEMTEDMEDSSEGEIPELPSADDEPQDIVTPEAPQAPVVNNGESVDSARDELVNSIIAAVDKYIETKSNKENDEVQAKIAKMQEELKKMTESLKA